MRERLKDVQIGWVASGWFLSVAVTSLILIALTAFGFAEPDRPGESIWVAASLLIGFVAGGFMVGTRVPVAPTLHGFSIGLFSLVAWLLVNLLLGEAVGATTWRSLAAITLSALLALQAVAAVVGARIGVRWASNPPTTD